MKRLQSEPVAVLGAIEALLIAVLALVASLAGWSADTVALAVAVVSAAIVAVGSIVARSRVTPYTPPRDENVRA